MVLVGENAVKYWSSTVGCAEKSGCIKRTKTLLRSAVHSA